MNDFMDFLHNNNLKKKKQEHNIALMMDFATNLMSMLSKGKGGHYSFATNNANITKERYNEMQRSMLQAQRDYNGNMASAIFKDILQNNNNVNGLKQNHIISGFNSSSKSILLKPVTLKPGLTKSQKPQLMSLSGLERNKIFNKK